MHGQLHTSYLLIQTRKNITYWVHSFENDDICNNFQWLVDLLQQEKSETPRLIIFFRQIKYIAEVYEFLETNVRTEAYVNYKEGGPNDDRNRLFDMFHMKTDDDVKDSIGSSYIKIRMLFYVQHHSVWIWMLKGWIL